MVKKEVTQTMEEFLEKAESNINVEPHLDEAIIEPAGFFRKAVTSVGLWKLVAVKPTQILAKPVAEFLLNLKENQIRSSITDPSTGKLTYVSLIKIAEILDLPREGVDSFSKLGLSVEVEYSRFAAKRTVAWKDRGKNMRTDLEKPYNLICELFTKSVVCHIGGLGQVSDNKLFAVTAIVDSITGTKFNWFNWFIRNIQDAAKDFEFEEGSNVNIVRKGELRIFGKLSYALEQLFPGRNWTETIAYKKMSVFNDLVNPGKPLVDRGVINVNVRSTVAFKLERRAKG